MLPSERRTLLPTNKPGPPGLEGDVRGQLAERFREVAALTALLQEQEKAYSEQQRLIEWLCQVAAALYPRRGWRAIMSAALGRRRARHILKSRGLFDSEEYLQLNPDVAVTGGDPLIHYLCHGLGEGRPRGVTDFQNYDGYR